MGNEEALEQIYNKGLEMICRFGFAQEEIEDLSSTTEMLDKLTEYFWENAK